MIEFLTPNGKKIFRGEHGDFVQALKHAHVKDTEGWFWLSSAVLAFREEDKPFDAEYEARAAGLHDGREDPDSYERIAADDPSA